MVYSSYLLSPFLILAKAEREETWNNDPKEAKKDELKTENTVSHLETTKDTKEGTKKEIGFITRR